MAGSDPLWFASSLSSLPGFAQEIGSGFDTIGCLNSYLVFARFWYENEAVFTAAQRDQLRQANLGKVLCDNGDDIRKAPRDVFLTTSSLEELEECSSLPSISLRPWADCALEEEVEVRTRRGQHKNYDNNYHYHYNE